MMAIDCWNVGWLEAYGRSTQKYQGFQQIPFKGVCWTYFCSISQASKRMPWLISSTLTALGGAAANLPETVTKNGTTGEILKELVGE